MEGLSVPCHALLFGTAQVLLLLGPLEAHQTSLGVFAQA